MNERRFDTALWPSASPPTFEEVIPGFEVEANTRWGAYEQVISSIFVPRATGNHTFLAACDDWCAVVLATRQRNRARAALPQAGHQHLQYEDGKGDVPRPVRLEEGVPYLLEVYGSEGGGGDWFDVSLVAPAPLEPDGLDNGEGNAFATRSVQAIEFEAAYSLETQRVLLGNTTGGAYRLSARLTMVDGSEVFATTALVAHAEPRRQAQEALRAAAAGVTNAAAGVRVTQSATSDGSLGWDVRFEEPPRSVRLETSPPSRPRGRAAQAHAQTVERVAQATNALSGTVELRRRNATTAAREDRRARAPMVEALEALASASGDAALAHADVFYEQKITYSNDGGCRNAGAWSSAATARRYLLKSRMQHLSAAMLVGRRMRPPCSCWQEVACSTRC